MKIDMKVVEILPLKNQVFRVFLSSIIPLDYVAGQYLEVVLSDKNIPLSIANAGGENLIELHIRHTPGHTVSDALINALHEVYQKSQTIPIQLPFGQSTIEHLSHQLPTILVARGTGFSPIKAVIEAMIQKNWQVPVHLYWEVRLKDDYYLKELPEQWMDLNAKGIFNFRYTPLVSPDETDTLIEAVITDYKDLSSYQIMAAGPFDLMFKARNAWCARGLLREHMHSDAFLGE